MDLPRGSWRAMMAASKGRGIAAGRSTLRTLSTLVLLVAAGLWAYRVACWLHDRTVTRRVLSHREIIERWSGVYNLPVDLVQAVIRVESAGEAEAVSHKKAKGLMQLTENAEMDVLRKFKIDKEDGADRFFEPEYNIRIGMAYLRLMIDRFDADVYSALAAYNMGPTKLRKLLKAHRGLSARQVIDRHAPEETRNYCRKIFELTDGRYATLPAGERD